MGGFGISMDLPLTHVEAAWTALGYALIAVLTALDCLGGCMDWKRGMHCLFIGLRGRVWSVHRPRWGRV